jgi:F-type H+-transporting ATPase subunit gamma
VAGSTRDIQKRIKSIENIGKVTRAMEAVSASKMRRAQEATLRSRAYAEKAAEIMAHLRAQPGSGTYLHPLLQEHPRGRPGVVLITPDRGLTGGLVLNIIRFALRNARENIDGDPAWVAVGGKGRDFLARNGADMVAEFTSVHDRPAIVDITPISRLALDGFLGDDFSSLHLVYAHFESVVKQDLRWRRLLPIEIPEYLEPVQAEFEFEPSPEAVLNEVLERLLEMRIYQAVLEAQASEHSARMVAMRNASDAAEELVEDLTLTYNKARQSDITGEILDIAGGAEALRQARGRG